MGVSKVVVVHGSRWEPAVANANFALRYVFKECLKTGTLHEIKYQIWLLAIKYMR
jgi:hypothetical protein